MFSTYFYHQRIRKAVATFGSMFNDIYVLRTGASGAIVSTKKVPLSYSNKDKMLERISTMEGGDTQQSQIAVKLPRMGFEITSIQYDPTRQLTKTTNINRAVENSITGRHKIYTGTPYNIGFQLNIYAKTMDDALQIVEQIIPYFTPQYTVTVKPLNSFTDIKEDVPIVLNSVSFSDDYEGSQESRRTIIYILDFEMKVNFRGPIPDSGTKIIRKVTNQIYNYQAGDLADSDLKIETLTVLPSLINVNADSDYGFTTTLVNISDSA
jgi:hypothetical protein